MRDLRALVRDRVAALGLPPDREDKIVEEWAAQLADVHADLRAHTTEDEAREQLLAQLPSEGTCGARCSTPRRCMCA
ncbi:MAG: hypothetical protein R2712_13555 [Vicinamibacterales bacterium]